MITDKCLKIVILWPLATLALTAPLIRKAKTLGKIIATDVHVLNNVYDEYNRDF